MTCRTTRSLLLTCTAMAVFASSVAMAQENAQGENTVLETISVKGKRVARPGSATDTPLTTETSQAEIENRQIVDIEDLGRTAEPGVGFNRNTGAINIRGLEGSRVLTTIDGIPVPYLSDATRDASGGVDAFDFNSLSAVDVMRGADSSRAGPGALGGVLGLRTLEPEDLIGEGRDWGGVAKTNYDSSDDSFGGSAAVAKRIEGTSILFQGGYRKGHERESNGDVGGYGATRTIANPSDFDQYNLLFKLRQEFEGGHMLGLTAERFRRDRDTDSKINQTLTGNYRPGDYLTNEATERDRVSIDYRYESSGTEGLIDNAWMSLYWLDQTRATGYDGYRSTSVVGPIGRLNDYTEETFGLIGALQNSVDSGYLRHNIVLGFDLAKATSEQYSSGYDNCRPPYTGPYMACANLHTNQADTPKVESGRIGVYLDDEISFGETGFTLTPGIRFDWVRHSPQMTDAFARNASNPVLPGDFEDSAFSPKVRLGYQAAPDVELYAQWAMAFRAPTAGELYASFGGPGTYLRLGNPDLESETSNGFEIGANLGDADFGGRINLFYNRYKNFIDVRSLNAAEAAAAGYDLSAYPQGGITRGVNLDRARIYGVELSGHKRFDNGFGIRGALVYADGKDLNTGDFIQSVAPLKAVVGVTYDTEHWGVGLDWIGVKEARGETVYGARGGTSYVKTPGYGIFDLTGWWEPEQVKGLKINAGIYNLFDKTYYDYATVRTGGTQDMEYYSEPGRTFKISLTQRF